MLNRTRALLLVTVTAVVVSACSSGTSSAPATKPTGGGTTVTAAGKGVAGTTTVGAGPSQLTGELTSSLSGFSPETSGFSFADYATDAGTTNLTATEVQRFFGVRVCANGTPDGCILTPPAERWMAIANALMADGHGEGMAVLALLLHEHAADAAVLGDGATETSEAKLAGNEGLQREIAYWNATQVLAPTATTRGADLSPSDVVAKLRQSFGPGGDETYTLGVRQVVDGSPRAGRTLAPYGIVDKGDGTVEVAVYDSSFPGQARAVKVDTKTQVWSYDGGGDAPDPRARYEGDGSAPNLLLTPISARRQPQTCPFCAPPSTPAPRLRGAVPGQPLLPPEINSALIFSGPGSAPMLAAAAAWDGLAADLASSAASFASVTSGLAGTAWQGPAASAMAAAATPYTQWLQTASGQGESSAAQAQTVAAAFSMDPTQSYAVTIPASPSPVSAPSLEQTAAKTTSVAFVSAGVTYHVDGIPLDADKPQLVLFRPADGLVAYYSEGSSSLSIGAGFEADGADYAFSASDVDMPTGGFVVAKLDRGAGTFTVRNLAAATDTYALTMRRIDDAGQLEFRNDGIDLSSGAAIDVDYQPWDADGKALAARTRSAGGATAVELPDE